VIAPSNSEQSLLKRVAAQEEDAMKACLQAYGNLVWGIIKRYVSDNGHAEDITQETFTALWKSAKRFDSSIASEKTFVCTIARRQAIDHLRKMKRQPQFEALHEYEHPDVIVTETNENTCWDAEHVRLAIQGLPTETQQLFSLHFDKGMTHPEIAKSINLPLGTVKTRLRRGLIELRNKITASGDFTQTQAQPNS
jgi:RNA polymerase sigma-70 factor (ECF subfamily)|tara:strand:- start:3480 stop:4064 length:585 start_codon:yes stop_codon:yes gene_type:complete